jgi:hypothetical protein
MEEQIWGAGLQGDVGVVARFRVPGCAIGRLVPGRGAVLTCGRMAVAELVQDWRETVCIEEPTQKIQEMSH